MSYITDVMIYVPNQEAWEEGDKAGVTLGDVNKWLLENTSQQLADLTAHEIVGRELDSENRIMVRTHLWGGGKVFTSTIWGGAFNYLPESEFMEFLRRLPWNERENVQTFLHREQEGRFAVFTLGDTSDSRWEERCDGGY